MPNFQRLISHDEDFRNSHRPTIINDLPARTEADREYFISLVRETYIDNTISVIPRCSCMDTGGLIGAHLMGEVCDICGTEVKEQIEEELRPSLWFRRPRGVEKLISPIIWIMLKKRLTKSRYCILQWLTDRNYRPNIKVPDIVLRLQAEGIPRSYNYFVQNFDRLIDWLFSQPDFEVKPIDFMIDTFNLPEGEKDPLLFLLKRDRHLYFSDYIPIPNKSLLVLEKSALGDYAESSTFDIQDCLNTMLSIDLDHYDQNESNIENRTARILNMLASYHYTVFDNNYAPKSGWLRKQVYGGRGNHGFRTVITPHREFHEHDEIHPPWCIAVTAFQTGWVPLLMAGGVTREGLSFKFTHNEAVGFLHSHVNRYHPILDYLFTEAIASTRDKCIPAIIQRN